MNELYMEFFEELAISTFEHKPSTWIRYVDDTFVIIKNDNRKIAQFLDHINSLRPSIRFTMEKEKNNQLPFLDVLIVRKPTSLVTTVYRKPTNTGRYLNFNSNHPYSTKFGIAKNLVNRAKIICSNETHLKTELKEIENCLRANGFPKKVISKSFDDFPPSNKELTSNLLVIPYVNGISEQIMRKMSKHNIVTRFKNSKTLKSILVDTKPKSSVNSKNVIYKIPCECGGNYIGETKRPLEVRIKEHQFNVRRGETSKSKIAEHVWDNQHHISWKNVTILGREENTFKRKFIEASYMKCNKDIISKPSLEINSVWTSLLKNEMTFGTPSDSA